MYVVDTISLQSRVSDGCRFDYFNCGCDGTPRKRREQYRAVERNGTEGTKKNQFRSLTNPVDCSITLTG